MGSGGVVMHPPTLDADTWERQPADWYVMWCPVCFYAVTWDAATFRAIVEVDDWYGERGWYALLDEACRHDCPYFGTVEKDRS